MSGENKRVRRKQAARSKELNTPSTINNQYDEISDVIPLIDELINQKLTSLGKFGKRAKKIYADLIFIFQSFDKEKLLLVHRYLQEKVDALTGKKPMQLPTSSISYSDSHQLKEFISAVFILKVAKTMNIDITSMIIAIFMTVVAIHVTFTYVIPGLKNYAQEKFIRDSKKHYSGNNEIKLNIIYMLNKRILKLLKEDQQNDNFSFFRCAKSLVRKLDFFDAKIDNEAAGTENVLTP